MEIVVVYVAPIPVGHRVRVVWHQLNEPGIAGQVRTDERPHQPMIEDLDTGVTYWTDWPVGTDRRRSHEEPFDIRFDLRDGLEVERVLEGTVRACRVVTVRGYADLDVQTHLVVEPDDA